MKMKKLDENRHLSEQDYGGFLEVATLEEAEDGQLFLTISAGYDREGVNDADYYRVSSRPMRPLAEVFNCDLVCNPGTDQSKELSEEFGVEFTKIKQEEMPDYRPWI